MVGAYQTVYPFSDKVDGATYPRVSTRSGEIIDGVLPENLLKDSALKESAPVKGTAYKVLPTGKGLMPRVIVLSSSGDKEFDSLGAKHLMRYFLSSVENKELQLITIAWRRTGGVE